MNVINLSEVLHQLHLMFLSLFNYCNPLTMSRLSLTGGPLPFLYHTSYSDAPLWQIKDPFVED